VAQLYPQAPGTHFSRLLRHAWATVGLFFSPITRRGKVSIQIKTKLAQQFFYHRLPVENFIAVRQVLSMTKYGEVTTERQYAPYLAHSVHITVHKFEFIGYKIGPFLSAHISKHSLNYQIAHFSVSNNSPHGHAAWRLKCLRR
jgi:hypothetical protein